MTAIGSVVIPAHDEASVIGRCLDALTREFDEHELEIVVVCNGCTDNTAATARRTRGVQVAELADASKPAALRIGDRMVRAFPRVYLDADILVPGSSVREMLDRLRTGPPLAARPPIRYDTRRASVLVRRYYAARVRTPSVMTSLWGAGVYGLAREGRARFGDFPDVVADDLFVAELFGAQEFEIVATHPAIVTTPRTMTDLVRVLGRTTRGNTAVRAHSTVATTARELARVPTGGPAAALDVGVYASAALAGRVAGRFGRRVPWARDHGSRAA
jgi:glycosyltransferase involved in cell wall biosynthesis